MPERLNQLAVWVAAIVYFLFGWLWYTIFAAPWTAFMGKSMPAPSPALYIESFVLGLILAYATGIALTRRPGDQTAGQGISFALFMGISIYGTQTLNQALYEGRALGLWLIDFGYVIVGFAIMAAIIGAWKRRTV
jgi:hypothetical protein